MILTAHQPVYLPWMGLFHKIALADTYVSFNQVQYLPKDWNNRNKIKTANGVIWLTVPVLKSGHRKKRLTEIKINNDFPWARKHWKSILQNYSKAPYFKSYADFFEDIYLKKSWEYLCELNDYMLRWFLETLSIRIKFADAREYNFEGEKSELVLDMCLKLNAKLYIFGALGRDYAETKNFQKKNISVYFQDYNHPHYPQLHGNIQTHLSVVDWLFNCGQNSLEIIMSGNVNKDDLERRYGLRGVQL